MLHQQPADRWHAFWAGTNPSPMICAAIPKRGKQPATPPAYLEAFHGGDSYRVVAQKLLAYLDTHEFIGDAIPYYTLSFGADDVAAFLGADLLLGDTGDTSWPTHSLQTLQDATIRFDPNGKWWNRLLEFHDTLKRETQGAIFLGAPTLTAGLDCLVGLYGASNLIMDMMDDPALVHAALRQIDTAYTEILAACQSVFGYAENGSITRHGLYHAGTTGVPQCDFSCMISPDMFSEFAYPSLAHEVSLLDAAEYHLDGKDAIRHLGSIAALDKIRIIQWVAGAGAASQQDWTPLYQDILRRGKAVFASGKASDMLRLQTSLRTNQAVFQVSGLNSREEADVFFEDMERAKGAEG